MDRTTCSRRVRRSPRHRLVALPSLFVALSSIGPASAVAEDRRPDPEAADRQYRVARRLAAEGSPQAADALARVVELDPKGVLADDALVERAKLEGAPAWPEDLGRLDRERADRALAFLRRVLDELPDGDRTPEARLRAALLMLEPLSGRDPAVARLELLTVAAADRAGPWGRAARYVVGWLDERRGNPEAARGAYHRLLIDAPGTPAAGRARVGLGRLDLREGRFGDAAVALQEAVEQNVAAETRAEALRELAVRAQMRRLGQGGGWGRGGPQIATGSRNLVAVARWPDGGALIADGRTGTLIRLDADGGRAAEWSLAEPQALAVDGFGRVWAAAGELIYQVGVDGPRPVASQGGFAPVSAIAGDDAGALWLADRRGTRVGRIAAGAALPVAVWQARELRASALVWDGRRMVALDARSGRLFEIGADGAERPLVTPEGLQKPAALAADVAGQLAVVDTRGAAVVLLDRHGAVVERFQTAAVNIGRPVSLALGPDGSLDLIDGSTGSWTRVP